MSASFMQVEQLAIAQQLVLIQQEALHVLRTLTTLYLKVPKILALLEETLKSDLGLTSTRGGIQGDHPEIIMLLDAVCRTMRDIMNIADERG